MSRSGKKKKRKPSGSGIKSGMAPGTMVFIGEQRQEQARIDLIHYNEASLNELGNVTVPQCSNFAGQPGIIWLNVSGVHDLNLIASLGKCFDLHPMTLEDIVNTTQRPKLEEFPQHLFIVFKMMTWNAATDSLSIEHVSLILGKNYVLSFLEDAGDVFATVRSRLRAAADRIRSLGADYLAYSLMDAVVDQYFLIVERIGDRIEDIDEQILIDPRPEDIKEIHHLKRDILKLRKAVWPFREGVGKIAKSGSSLVDAETGIFWRDLHDHTIQIIDMAETCRDILGGLHDTYLSSISNRMNEIMKVLTIIATIFIPLTFIVGVYGMNFKDMPELEWRHGYCAVWGLMLAIALGLTIYFKRKKWM